MNDNVVMLTHVLFGVLCLLGGIWVFVDALNATNPARIRAVSLATAVAMWVAYLIAGYWYIFHYAVDKAIILKGPWPFAHSVCMETKEHIVIMLLLLATYLPIAARGNLSPRGPTRTVVLWTSGLVVLLALAADGFGGLISMGVKLSLLPK